MSDRFEVREGDALAILRDLPDSTFHGILTDPPYGLAFMGAKWDHAVPGPEVWTEALRVVKPGAHALVFGGTRTWHRLAVAIEDAGWEIRDTLVWLYGSGFPKSHGFGGDLGDRWEGYGTALKPAWEPIILAMRPVEGTFAGNAVAHDVAGLNIEAARIGSEAVEAGRAGRSEARSPSFGAGLNGQAAPSTSEGRWPANAILDPVAGRQLDAQTGELGHSAGVFRSSENHAYGKGMAAARPDQDGMRIGFGDSGGASRFFYSAKASRQEREAGVGSNAHPTVKPIALAEYLARLLRPPSGGRILVPFSGSGSEMIGALRAGWAHALGIELSPEYATIARRRIRAWVPMDLDYEDEAALAEQAPLFASGGSRG